jgi:hypothetical protein
MVISNLMVAKTSLENKKTQNASLQLLGAENILLLMSKNQAKQNKEDETNIDKALKSVKEARRDIKQKKYDDATTAIDAALADLGSNGAPTTN